MATLKRKVRAERRMRQLLASEGLPDPDWVEYGYECIRFIWKGPKLAVVIDLDEDDDDEDGVEPTHAPYDWSAEQRGDDAAEGDADIDSIDPRLHRGGQSLN